MKLPKDVLILIADDEAGVRKILEQVLQEDGYQVMQAADGREALKLFEENPFPLVIADIVMPGLNGFQATRELSSNPETSAIPVIIVTRKNQQVDRVWGMRQGARDYITKPVKEGTLMGLIKEALAA